MCNVFIAVSQDGPIDTKSCLAAMNAVKPRGPDIRYYNTPFDNVFLGCDVLSVVGIKRNLKYYTAGNIELYYNGEIYNLPRKNNMSDTESLVKFLAEQQDIFSALKELDGMFGLVVYDKHKRILLSARDIIGEKTLYVYHTEKFYIISSTLLSILTFIPQIDLNYDVLNRYLHTRHLLTYNQTIYKDIYQVPPGVCELYDLTTYKKIQYTYDAVSNYISESQESEQTLIKYLDFLLDKNIKQMLCDKKIGVSFSGGIDSSLIAWYVSQHTNSCDLIATNCIGKDYISNNLSDFNKYFNNITTIDINEEEWHKNLHIAYEILGTPLPSHSFLTQLIYTQHLKERNIVVNYSGVGADELFGGYPIYSNTAINNKNISPYSSVNNLPVDHNYCLSSLQKDLYKPWELAFNKTKSNILAMSYADTVVELVDDGLRNGDQITGWYGIENRSPFVRKDIIKFAFSLPEEYKKGKPLLKKLFKQKFPDIQIKPKQGYAGFPNEVKKYINMSFKAFPIIQLLNINSFKYTKQLKWKLINLQLFYESYSSRICSISP